MQPTEDGFLLRWSTSVGAGQRPSATWRLDLDDPSAPFVGAALDVLSPPNAHEHAPGSLLRLLSAGFDDASSLLMAPREDPSGAFLAAGSPWFLTLFGRDSLVAASLLQPHCPELAATTLSVLAERRGRRVDPETAEQPGKILHEVRRETLHLVGSDVSLPPLYFGTIDATCLWIRLLGRISPGGVSSAWREPLLDALDWLRHHADADGDGFLEYIDESGHGLANQGWKDSGDSVRWADGSLATAPIALAEVQGYAHAAALAGARMLEDTEPDLAAFWRDWAATLATRFREQFWVRDAEGPYVAIALDAHKRPVTGLASNMGHLLGTGILTREEAGLVVARLMGPSMRSGYGVRTLATTNGGYWPLGYHVGSVWTHDTGMIIDGMLADGFADEAAALAGDLLRAAEGFGYRMPELFSGQSEHEVFPPQPYPASCRPQAWAAATAVVVARALGAL